MSIVELIEVDTDTLRIIRKGKKLTQANVAQAIGISTRSYQSIESGDMPNPGVQTMGKICDVMGIQLMQVLRETNDDAHQVG